MKTLFLIISMVVLTQAQNTSETDGHRVTTPTATSATPSTTQSAQPTLHLHLGTSSTPSRTSTIRASRSSTTGLSTSSATTQTDTFITSTPGLTDSSTDTVGSTSPTLSQTTGRETTTTWPAGPETTTTSTEVPPSPPLVTQPPTATTEASSTWLIVGVSVGVLLLIIVIIIIVIVVCVYRRKKKVVKEPLIKPEPARIPTYITNPRVQKKPKPSQPQHGYRATGPNAPYHYEAKDFHWRGPAKFDTRPIGIEDLPEPSSNETALSYHSDEHVEFDKDLNEVYEIGPEVEEYLDRPNPRNKLKKSKSKESSGRHDPNKAVIER